MTEADAIERITDAMLCGIDKIYGRDFMHNRAQAAWNEMKAIAKEDDKRMVMIEPRVRPRPIPYRAGVVRTD